MKNTVPLITICLKQNIAILLFFFAIGSVFGQVKIGDTPENIDPASLLELESTDKAMVLSRITTAQMQAITPLQGAVIYNIEEQCVFYYSGSNWVNLCRDASGFSIIDNGDNTYTVNDGTNPEFTFSTNTETITNIVQNPNGTFTYTNEAGEETVIANGSGTGTGTLSITDNGDDTYTVNDGTNPEFIITATPETVTGIVQNPNGTYTYTNEAGEETIIATTTTGTSTFSITDNGDNTYTFNDGTIPAFTLSANPETVTNIVQNPNSTFTYTNEAGDETIIANGSGTGTGSLSITDNGDNTYTVDDGTNPAFTITATPETVTGIVQNPNGTFTYTNEAGDETIITNGSGTGTGSLSITDNGDNTYTVIDGTNPAFTITATPETVTSISQNADGTYTYTNEAGDETIIDSNNLTITDNGDNTYTVNDGTNPAFTITATPETVTSISQNADGTYTYTNEAGDETIIASSELTITDNGDNTYTVNDGTNPAFTIAATPETVTSIAQNADGTYTYTNEAGDETDIAINALSITDNGDDTYSVDDGSNPEFTITAKPETVTSLIENGNGTYTYTNEAGDETSISFSGTSQEGSVFFADNANGLAESNGQFFWDNSNSRLGLGTNTNLTDRLTINGNIGISDGDEAAPSYRFLNDDDTGLFRSANNELGFTVGGTSNMKLTEGGLFLNNALPLISGFEDMPLLIRAEEVENSNKGELIGLEEVNGDLKWIINLDKETLSLKGGLSFVEAGGAKSRFYIENARTPEGFGRIGINTDQPQETLHVVGNIRVTDLPPTVAGDTYVTVDQFGRFHKSTSAQSSKSSASSVIKQAARWVNLSTKISLNDEQVNLSLFAIEDFKDGGINFYDATTNELIIKRSGRYEIKATISLIGNLQSNGQPANTYARISVNNIEKGAINVATNNGINDLNSLSSIHINDIFNFNEGDRITITLHSNANDSFLNFASSETSNFTIIQQ